MRAILEYADSLLRDRARDVDVKKEREYIKSVLKDMQKVLGKNLGVASPQVGEGIALFIVNAKKFPETRKISAFINPVITNRSDTTVKVREGCLSLPNEKYIVERNTSITIEFTSGLSGKRRTLTVKNLLAYVLQHEYDHLQGVMIDDIGEWVEEDVSEDESDTQQDSAFDVL